LVEGPFNFLGFLPRRGGKRRAALRRIQTSSEPSVLFESPHRIKGTLDELKEMMPARRATLCRELTKLHEQVVCASLTELAEQPEYRGEITLVVAASNLEPAAEVQGLPEVDAAIVRRLAAGDSVKTIVAELLRHTTLRHRELYARVLGLQKSRG
jgi:16S rRNA (cytidine1402-2'-O)-methyltransferase